MKPTKGSVNTGTKPDQSTKEEKKTKKREAECEAIGAWDAPLGAPTRRLSNWIVLWSSKLHNHPASRCALQHNSILVTDYSETPSLSHQKRPARTSGPGTSFLKYNVQINVIHTFNDLTAYDEIPNQFYFIYVILFSNRYLIKCTANNNYRSNECKPLANPELKSFLTTNKLPVCQIKSKL